MEDLIKGIINVAIGHPHQNRNQEQDDDGRHGGQSNSESREDRSRSTWAEVVSTGTDDDGVSHQQQQQNRWNRKEEESENDKWESPGHGERQSRRQPQQEATENAEWETVGERPSRRKPQKEEEEWQSAGEKHSRRRPQKVPADHWQTYKRPLAEQQYKDDVEYGADIEPSEEELAVLSQACSKLWELDSNRLVPSQDYQIDCGEGKKVYQNNDMAEGSLFDWVNEDIFRRPTYSRFCSLLDNYNPHEGFKEVVTNEEQQEQAAFIEEISRTAPIKYLHKYLTFKGVVSKNYQEFKKFMIDLWFRLYGRGGTSGSSSAFEHVFVGEIKQREEQEVSGFHNWLQFYLEESKGRVDYQGYIFPRRRGQVPDSETQLLTIQFKWNGILKSVSSTLVGVSPEFEVALYTLCFFMGEEDNHVEIGPYPVNIKCYRLGHDKIGSAFPIAEN